jgi:uncharacterized membrane protein YgcG
MRGLIFALLGSAIVPFAACSVYDEALTICQTNCGTNGRGGQGGGNGGDGGSGAVSGGGNGTGGGAYCEAADSTTYPAPPGPSAPSTKNIEIVAAQHTIDLGDAPPDPNNPPRHYLEIGFDLDEVCTTAANANEGSAYKCRLPAYAIGVPDGKGGIDNALGALIQGVRNQIGNFSSDNYSKSIQEGKSNVLLRMTDWNGEPNDDRVTVSTMVAAPFDSFTAGLEPEWKGLDAWPIASDAVINGNVDNPKFKDVNAYVTNYQVVATLAEANLRLDVGLTTTQFVKLDMKLTAAFVVCDIVPAEDAGTWGWSFSKCTLGGRWTADDLVKQLGQFPNPLDNNRPLCAGNDAYRTFKQGICAQVDIYHTLGSPTLTCDALTMGVTYTMKPALLGNVFNLRPIADRCCTPPPNGTCIPGSPDDLIHNPKFDCCASIDAPDGGALAACGITGTGGSGGAGGGGGTGGRASGGAGGRASGGAGGATGGAAATGGAGGTDGGSDGGGDASRD